MKFPLCVLEAKKKKRFWDIGATFTSKGHFNVFSLHIVKNYKRFFWRLNKVVRLLKKLKSRQTSIKQVLGCIQLSSKVLREVCDV